jgi:hypothetical protein
MKPILLLMISFVPLSCIRNDSRSTKALTADSVEAAMEVSKATKLDRAETEFHYIPNLDCKADSSDKIYTYLNRRDVPNHLFTLILKCNGDSLSGKLLGPLPMAEHGLAFFRADLANIKIDTALNIELEYVHGKLYDKMITIENYMDNLDEFDIGISRAVVLLKGKNYGDSLVFSCFADEGDCYAKKMTFTPKN